MLIINLKASGVSQRASIKITEPEARQGFKGILETAN